MDISQCTSAPHREPDLALSGTHGALPLEDLDNLYGVATAHPTDRSLNTLNFLHTILSDGWEVYQQRVLTPDNPGPVHTSRA